MKPININKLSNSLQAYKTCIERGNTEWEEKHRENIEEMLKNLPSGSGLDNGVKFDWDNSTANKLIFSFGFHHLNEGGFYDGWTQHKLTLKPAFIHGYEMKISGPDRNWVKDYLSDLFHEVFQLEHEIEN